MYGIIGGGFGALCLLLLLILCKPQSRRDEKTTAEVKEREDGTIKSRKPPSTRGNPVHSWRHYLSFPTSPRQMRADISCMGTKLWKGSTLPVERHQPSLHCWLVIWQLEVRQLAKRKELRWLVDPVGVIASPLALEGLTIQMMLLHPLDEVWAVLVVQSGSYYHPTETCCNHQWHLLPLYRFWMMVLSAQACCIHQVEVLEDPKEALSHVVIQDETLGMTKKHLVLARKVVESFLLTTVKGHLQDRNPAEKSSCQMLGKPPKVA